MRIGQSSLCIATGEEKRAKAVYRVGAILSSKATESNCFQTKRQYFMLTRLALAIAAIFYKDLIQLRRNMLVKDIMSPVSDAITTSHALDAVVRLMHMQKMSCALVCEKGRLLGIVTERDIVRTFYKHLYDKEYGTISEVMTENPVSINESTTIQDALVLARNHNIRHLPVLDEAEIVVGIVNQSILMQAFLDSLELNKTLKTNIKKLEALSMEDPLLKVGNRRSMEVELNFIQDASKRYKKPYSIAIFDIDYFKQYNDYYGHQKGDETLILAAELMKKHKRKVDQIYRYGGEEFLLLMPNTETKGAITGCQRIHQAIADAQIEHAASPLHYVTISAGIASSSATCTVSNSNWQQIVEKADQALYDAKQNGRNRCKAN